jgi:hypothetical protein
MRQSITALIAALAVIGAVASVHAAVPTAEDFAACNAEARDAVSGPGSASPATEPTKKDHDQARQHKAGATPGAEKKDETGRIVESENPQLQGMDADGAKDPAYRAAYRSCMRKAGF